jgi:predicted nucleic acid-binding protein
MLPDDRVLDVVAGSTLTAYDAEFVALAAVLSVPLVTADKGVLKAFPGRTLTMEAFLAA